MALPNGLVIAIVGAPRSGKSFLAKRLAAELGAELFLEGEEADFPQRIVEDIKTGQRPLERMLWFRNKIAERHLAAAEYKKAGKTVILDTFWLSYRFFLYTLADDFERALMGQMLAQDENIFGWPDVVIFLQISEQMARKFCQMGGRSYDQTEDFLKNCILPVSGQYDEYFANMAQRRPVLMINRDDGQDFCKRAAMARITGGMTALLPIRMAAADEYDERLAREREKSAKKYGDSFERGVGNMRHDAHDYAINELVGMTRYGEIVAARAAGYGCPEGVRLGEEMRSVAADLAVRLIAYRKRLLLRGFFLGEPEYKKPE